MIRASHQLQLGAGLLLAVPIPEAAAAEGAAIQQAIQESLQEADQRGIAGADVSGVRWLPSDGSGGCPMVAR
jgi:pseudouridine-5'-phosphate glycosidase